jgi:demethylspheroidene O-methyltransferase
MGHTERMSAPSEPPASLLERWRDWRNRTVARPGFQRWAAAFPLTRPTARRHARELFDLVAGFVYTQVLLACVRLDIFERLSAGPMPLAALADRIGLGAEGTERLVAAAVSLELLERRSGGRVALGRLGAPMVGNRAVAAMVEHHATLYGDIADPVALLRREGRPAMAGYWPYVAYAGAEAGAEAVTGPASPAALAPERVAEYSALMSASQPLVTQEVLAAYRFSRHQVLLDVGGGEGSFLVAVAAQAPQLQLMLFDLPAVAARAQARLEAAGLAGRASTHGGDFFSDELPRGADAISLVRVAFDHPDDRVLRLLKAARRALPAHGTLLLAEPMSDVPGAEAMGDAYFGFYLLAMGRGRPRSAAHLSRLLHEAGFAEVRAVPTQMPLQAGLLVARGVAASSARVNPSEKTV